MRSTRRSAKTFSDRKFVSSSSCRQRRASMCAVVANASHLTPVSRSKRTPGNVAATQLRSLCSIDCVDLVARSLLAGMPLVDICATDASRKGCEAVDTELKATPASEPAEHVIHYIESLCSTQSVSFPFSKSAVSSTAHYSLAKPSSYPHVEAASTEAVAKIIGDVVAAVAAETNETADKACPGSPFLDRSRNEAMHM